MSSLLRRTARGYAQGLRALLGERRGRVTLGAALASILVVFAVYQPLVLRPVPVALLDADNSEVSRTARRFLAASPDLDLRSEPVRSLEEARSLLLAGTVAGVVLLPSGLAADLQRGRPHALPVAVDTSRLVLGRSVQKSIAQALGTLGVGVELTLLQKLGEPSAALQPAAMPLRLDVALLSNPATNYGVYVIPGLVFFLLQIWVLLSAALLLQPGRGPQGLAARLGAQAAVTTLGFGLGAGALLGLLPLAAIRPPSGPGLLLGTWLALLLCVQLLVVGLHSVLRRRPLLALEVGLLLGMLSLMLSGVTWPSDSFPVPLAALGEIMPLTPFLRGAQRALHRPCAWLDLVDVFRHFGWQALAFFALALLGRALHLGAGPGTAAAPLGATLDGADPGGRA